jgi:thiosulfate reductase cytochrome b subunit
LLVRRNTLLAGIFIKTACFLFRLKSKTLNEMKASTERKVIRWLHLIISIPVVGYIYGPVAELTYAANAVRFIFFPVLVLSGLWLWKGYVVKNWVRGIMSSTSL